jgi:tetratricopeptide (TPR) repeat protein
MYSSKSKWLLLVIILNGCSMFEGPDFNDPRTKVTQAYESIATGRPVPAEKLATEAAKIYESKNDYIGAGTAYSALGMLYSSPAYRSHKEYYENKNTYDPTYNKSIAFYKKAVDASMKGGDYWGAANSLIGIGDGYTNQNELSKACDAYTEALKVYTDPNAKVTKMTYTWNSKYPTYKAMLEAIIENSCNK